MGAFLGFDLVVVDYLADEPADAAGEDQEAGCPGELFFLSRVVVGVGFLQHGLLHDADH